MSVEAKLYSVLTNAETLGTFVSGRVYPIRMEQGTGYPAVVYRRNGGDREWALDGYSTLENAAMLVEIHATAVTARRLVSDAVISAISNATDFTGLAFGSPLDQYNDEHQVYTRTYDVSIWNAE